MMDEIEEYLYNKPIARLTTEELEYIEEECDWDVFPELPPKPKISWWKRYGSILWWHIYGFIFGLAFGWIIWGQ